MKNAILLGASGFVGSNLLLDLLDSPDYGQVYIIVRKTLGLNHPKLIELIGDYQSFHLLIEKIVADEIFITLGTTGKKTPDRQQYYKIDHDYPVEAARIALKGGTKSVFIVTAVGANANSSIFYTRTKGEIERDILSLNFERTFIFRPSLIMGKRKESRRLEKIFIKLWAFINPLLRGESLNKYRGIAGPDIARAMMNAAIYETEKVKIFHWQEMTDLLKR